MVQGRIRGLRKRALEVFIGPAHDGISLLLIAIQTPILRQLNRRDRLILGCAAGDLLLDRITRVRDRSARSGR